MTNIAMENSWSIEIDDFPSELNLHVLAVVYINTIIY